MSVTAILSRVKYLVSQNRFQIVNRREHHAQSINSHLAKQIVRQLSIADFCKCELDYDVSGEYVWVFKTTFELVYYIRFKFITNNQMVKFISFHIARY